MKISVVFFFIGTVLFFTACSADQAVKKYYRACLKGNYAKAGKQVVKAQRDAYKIFEKQLDKKGPARLRGQKVRLESLQVRYMDDTTAVAMFDLMLQTEQSSDTIPKLVMLKKEKGRWRICNGMLFTN